VIEDQDFSPILRAKEDAVRPDEVAGRERTMLASLDGLASEGVPYD